MPQIWVVRLFNKRLPRVEVLELVMETPCQYLVHNPRIADRMSIRKNSKSHTCFSSAADAAKFVRQTIAAAQWEAKLEYHRTVFLAAADDATLLDYMQSKDPAVIDCETFAQKKARE